MNEEETLSRDTTAKEFTSKRTSENLGSTRPPFSHKRKRVKFKKDATRFLKIENESTNLGRYFAGLQRADKLTAHFIQGGRIDSNRKKH